MTVLDPARVVPVPWHNGAGTTRELATATDDDGTLWRISLADLTGDATFSVFPGVDRLLLALGALRLDVDGVDIELAAGDQTRFPGEARVSVVLDEPTRALNVMVRRGAWHADVVHRPADGPATPGTRATVPLGEFTTDVLLTPLPKAVHA